MPNSWKIAGSYFEVCNCDVACPCLFLSPPTSGDCTLLLAWHIDHGRFGQIDLDGLNAVLAVHSPGHMLEVKWKVALYIDERANQDRQDALTQIFSGQAGGRSSGFRAVHWGSPGGQDSYDRISRRRQTTQHPSRRHR